jgi:hypothetical protein
VKVSGGTVAISDFPLGGTAFVFVAPPRAVKPGQSLVDIPYTVAVGGDDRIAAPGGQGAQGQIAPATSGGVNKSRTILGFAPNPGQLILSWPVQLPDSPVLSLSFSTGLLDNTTPLSSTALSVRVNGTTLWQDSVLLTPGWRYGVVDLSAWHGKSALVELISNSAGLNPAQSAWAELMMDATAGGTCAASLSSLAPIAAPASGLTGTIDVSAATGCSWSAAASSDWIALKPSTGSGRGTVTYVIGQNSGPVRQTTLVVGGHPISVTQGDAPVLQQQILRPN